MKKGDSNPLKDVTNDSSRWLFCFAVNEETVFFKPAEDCRILVTGMGQTNAEKEIRKALARELPPCVITAGFSGGLNPKYRCGDVLFEEDAGLSGVLEASGALSAHFYCHSRVAVTACEKAQLWQTTGADAVEMESSSIRTICRENGIPSATVRVISDEAGSDLPLDFNVLMTADYRMNYLKLMGTLVGQPSLAKKLLEFQKETRFAAKKLGMVLSSLKMSNRVDKVIL